MARLGEVADRIRSKNAGPFTVTVDIFCSTSEILEKISGWLSNQTVADIYGLEASSVRRFELHGIRVLKFSFPRPTVQGHRLDRDMHSAQFAVLLEELDLPEDWADSFDSSVLDRMGPA